MLSLLRSLLHALWMLVTVIPWGIWMVVSSIWSNGEQMWWKAARWLRWQTEGLRIICGVQYRVSGMENLPQGKTSPGILLVKHQSTLETFLMPSLMPHPLAYVFKRELIFIPFFGWAMGRMDMIHIDRSQRAQAFNKVVEQGKRLLAQGIWVIMFPEGTRIPRGQKGNYKSGGTRLAVATGALLAAQVHAQASRRGRCLDRPADPEHRPRPGRTDARGRNLDRVGDAPAGPRSLRAGIAQAARAGVTRRACRCP